MHVGRLEQELELLRAVYPDLEYRLVDGVHWVRFPSYPVPEGWSRSTIEIAFQIPAQVGQAPYAFWVRPAIQLVGGGTPSNYAATASTPWGGDWAQFSWSPLTWMPKADIRAGANMLNFARSFADRFLDRS
jgi:hypothetical protein